MIASCVRTECQHCAEISRFKMGRTCVTLAFKPGPASLAPADTQQQESRRSEAIFRQLLWSFFLRLVSELTSAACNCFVAWFIQPFVPQPGRSMKVKLGGIETWKKKNPTWQLLSSAETACMYLLKCVCFHSTQAVQMRPPPADGEAYLTTTRKVENKT